MHPLIHWIENGAEKSARWRSENGSPPPKKVMVADDKMTADAAFRLASEGTALLWRGDFQNARQLLFAMGRRAEGKPKKNKIASSESAFNLHRQAQSQRARTLGMLLIPFEAGHGIPLRRSPDAKIACEEALGLACEDYVLSLRSLLGMIGAHEWHKKGVKISALASRIHPAYGVFSPIRGEYVDLVNDTPLPAALNTYPVAFDIGTGTGVLAAVLAKRGIAQIVATDQDSRALDCARGNMARLGLNVEVQQADLYPTGQAALIVCNPPWLPARPSSPLEYAVFDPESRMLKGFLAGLAAHLAPGGEGWLILSDLAEHLHLRSRDTLLELIANAGLQVLGRTDVKPRHPKATDVSDPLHEARRREVTSLWRLATR